MKKQQSGCGSGSVKGFSTGSLYGIYTMRLVPVDKFDDEACENMMAASNEDLVPYIDDLLECLQDLNWPIAGPVSERLSTLGVELVKPVLDVLNSDDDVWKYWIVSHFLYQVEKEVFQLCRFKLNSIKLHPTKGEVEEEVHDVVCELLLARKTA
ncbi:DUF5071 domain-containing protein [Marinobacter sp. ANT_B65]|uniref:DUF5071 domain-containing protein n=1 Tax=Marinobacter sp. ANT_B65 TaxID=2039467 RepID=UPI000BBF0288|nr:DUF5071 domain-containing protein [Marinobacter sp. ANT_B65]PCM43216.1 hypothetical protein CPA50_16900 [Marinobacter sp. ANT_B65]